MSSVSVLSSPAFLLFLAEVWGEIVGEFEELAARDPAKAERCRRFVSWFRDGVPTEGSVRRILELLARSRHPLSRGPFLEEVERLAMEDPRFRDAMAGEWDSRGGILVPKPAAALKPPRKKPRRRLPSLRPVTGVVSFPYRIDARENIIVRKDCKRAYRIPRGVASAAVNRLVQGLALFLCNRKSDALVRFTAGDARAFHKGSDDVAEFYEKCIERSGDKGAGNQKYGAFAQLRK